MRLWHKDLLPYLPSQQLISQWRECCAIIGALAKDHTPNHCLVNKVVDYDPEHFRVYSNLVIEQFRIRGYSITEASLDRFNRDFLAWKHYIQEQLPYEIDTIVVNETDLFKGWHSKRYLRQCYYNLQEKFDCGAITEEEWDRVINGYVMLGGAMKDE